MTKDEAIQWLRGERSTTNYFPYSENGASIVGTAQADAAMVQQAYWVLKAYHDGLIKEEAE